MTKLKLFLISILQGVIFVLELIYLQPILLRTSVESYTDINQSPLTFSLVVAILIQLLIVAGYPGYLVVKNRTWRPAISIFLLTVLWLVIFFSLLLFS